MRGFLVSLYGIASVVLQPALAQDPAQPIVPVQAKLVKTMEELHPDGSSVLQHIMHETYARNSGGSVYQKADLIDPETGRVQRSITTISNVAVGQDYVIDHQAKTVSMRPISIVDPAKSFAPRPRPPDSKRVTYLGRTCVILPFAGKQTHTTGEMWINELTNFLMFVRRETPIPGGKQVRTIRVTEFVTGIEPTASLFEPPPEGYVIEHE